MTNLQQGPSQDQTAGAASQVTFLVEKARGGSRTAFEELVNIFHVRIFRMAYYRTQSHMDAEDLTQEIFIQAFRNLFKLKKVDLFRAWLFSIAVNRVRDFLRKKRLMTFLRVSGETDGLDQSAAETGDQPDALSHLMRKDFWEQIELLLDKLSRVEREVFLLRFMDQLSIKEISQVLDKSESTVKTHLYRALKKFKKENRLIELLRGVAP